jgi:hypothetical protein
VNGQLELLELQERMNSLAKQRAVLHSQAVQAHRGLHMVVRIDQAKGAEDSMYGLRPELS